MKYLVKLGQGKTEPLQVPLTRGGAEFHINTEPRLLDEEQVEAVQGFIKDLPYRQTLVFLDTVMCDENDPLEQFSHDELDLLESKLKMPNSRKAKAGGTRQIHERVCLIREAGYINTGDEVRPALMPA